MRESYTLPSPIVFPECVPGDLRLRLQALIHDSIRRAAGDLANGGDVMPVAPGRALPAGERVALERLDAEHGSYAVPSYGQGGALTPVPLRQKEGGAATVFPGARWEHPRGRAVDDVVLEEGSPLADQQIARFPGGGEVRVRGKRFGVSTDLRRALTWGTLLFGGRPYAIFEGPLGESGQHYFTVAVTEPPRALRTPPPAQGAGGEGGVWRAKERIVWQPRLYDQGESPYLLRGVVVGAGEVMWPPDRDVVEEFYAELKTCDARGERLPQETARAQLFGEIDRLIALGKREEAVRILVELDGAAFLLLEWEKRAKYLELLCESPFGRAGEAAIAAIIRSLQSDAEIRGAQELLRSRYEMCAHPEEN